MADALKKDQPDRKMVLNQALRKAIEALGLTQAQLAEIIGKDRTAISRGQIDPVSKEGELALYFIRCYRALFALLGGNLANMTHWLTTANQHFANQAPLQAMKTIAGLVGVLSYLDAIRGKN
ncbi:MAG: XRE family transcriptional regulator [Limnobacter sp.]|nr:XRE family transcriptional regulator [Limnobacter sp.]